MNTSVRHPKEHPSDLRQQLRRQVRQARQQLTAAQQQEAARQLVCQAQALPELANAQHIAIYLSNDAELDTRPLIHQLWQQGKQLYLPVLHLFCPGYLLFQQYQPHTPLRPNRFGIAEPVPDVSQLRLVSELDIVFLPLVAFDASGQRLGMGGGFYDRTLASTRQQSTACQQSAAPQLIGLAHNCQQVAQVPAKPWDVPLSLLLSPARIWRFAGKSS